MIRGLGAPRLISTPSRHIARLGSGLPHTRGSPDFEQFCFAGFPGEHSSFFLSPLRLPFRHARAQLTRLCLIAEHIFRLLSPQVLRRTISSSSTTMILSMILSHDLSPKCLNHGSMGITHAKALPKKSAFRIRVIVVESAE